jgi:hypothetical protein
MPRDVCKLWLPGASHHEHDGRKGTDFKSVVAVVGLCERFGDDEGKRIRKMLQFKA